MQLRHMHFCIIILSKGQEKETAEHITVNKILVFEKGLDQKWSWHTKNTNSLQEKEGWRRPLKAVVFVLLSKLGKDSGTAGI